MKNSKEIYEVIGANLKQFRKKAGLSQQQLAEKCSVDRSKISDIENCKENFMFSTLLEIANGLNLDIRKLLAPLRKIKTE
ncbi:helix-turn-helix domain-containing protein [Pedobacter alpinus]|uniref:Helix-turn-helix domain-containing protein n=1 Tax=Pedobacter alpinus TaxID=1590643 RepID=A0ABW5TP85_9SPHI